MGTGRLIVLYNAARAPSLFFFFGVPTPFLGRPFFPSTCIALRRAPRPPACSFFLPRVAPAALFFLLASRCAARHVRPQAKPRSLARTPEPDGRTTRRAVRRHG